MIASMMADDEKVRSVLYFLRNCRPGIGPFIRPADIAEADQELEVNWYFNHPEHPQNEVNVFDPDTGRLFVCPLDADGEIEWECWEVVPERQEDKA